MWLCRRSRTKESEAARPRHNHKSAMQRAVNRARSNALGIVVRMHPFDELNLEVARDVIKNA